MKLFKRTVPTGIAHGTVTVLLDKNITKSDTLHSAEVTTYRSESDYSDGRRPDSVHFSTTLSEDLKRRDFTMNALALDPLTHELIDEHDGISDIRAKIIRTIGDPRERFNEDGLRTVRACRFTATLGFSIEPKTYEAIKDPLIQERSLGVATERFTDELWKGFKAHETSRMLSALQNTGLLDKFFTSLDLIPKTLSENDLKIINEVSDGSVNFKMAYWFKLLDFNTKHIISHASKKLKFSGQQSKDIENYIRFISFQERPASTLHQSPLYPYRAEEIRFFLSEIKEIYRDQTSEFIKGASSVFSKNVSKEDLLNILDSYPLIITDLDLKGDDLMKAGLKGPEIGRTMRKLQLHVINDPSLNKKEILIKMVAT
jgi:tRNA nucleotidyltransferase/poly(A) polymerase